MRVKEKENDKHKPFHTKLIWNEFAFLTSARVFIESAGTWFMRSAIFLVWSQKSIHQNVDYFDMNFLNNWLTPLLPAEFYTRATLSIELKSTILNELLMKCNYHVAPLDNWTCCSMNFSFEEEWAQKLYHSEFHVQLRINKTKRYKFFKWSKFTFLH